MRLSPLVTLMYYLLTSITCESYKLRPTPQVLASLKAACADEGLEACADEGIASLI